VIGSVDVRGGGTTNHVFAFSRVWSRLGHECHLLCLDPPESDSVGESPITTIALGGREGFARRLVPFARYGYTPALGKWLRANAACYDVIILNGLWNYTSYGTWLALRKSKVPYYVCPHGMLDPWLKHAAPIHHMRRLIFWKLFERKVIRDSRGVLFSAKEEERLANQSFLRGAYDNSYVLAYGVEDVEGDSRAQSSEFLAKFPRLRGRRYILFLGRIHPKKGLDLLIKAFARLAAEFPDCDLVIAGPDDVGLTPQLKHLGAKSGIDRRIHWTGMLRGNPKWGAFRLADYFVLPSHQENFGISIVEAMSASVPVLVTRKVNIWREVEMCGGGLATADTPDGVAHGLHLLLNLTPAERRVMAEKARAGYMAHFNLTNNAVEFLDLITRLNATGRDRIHDTKDP
jgi:glycosyltransferase involved in cell wall biosynthesis